MVEWILGMLRFGKRRGDMCVCERSTLSVEELLQKARQGPGRRGNLAFRHEHDARVGKYTLLKAYIQCSTRGRRETDKSAQGARAETGDADSVFCNDLFFREIGRVEEGRDFVVQYG